MKPPTPAEAARLAAGFNSHKDVATLLHRHPRTIRRAEMHGQTNFDLAHSMAGLYGCSANVFLEPTGNNRGNQPPSRPGGARRGVQPATALPGAFSARRRHDRGLKLV